MALEMATEEHAREDHFPAVHVLWQNYIHLDSSPSSTTTLKAADLGGIRCVSSSCRLEVTLQEFQALVPLAFDSQYTLNQTRLEPMYDPRRWSKHAAGCLTGYLKLRALIPLRYIPLYPVN